MDVEYIKKVLQVYTVEEIAEHNDVPVEDLLETLVSEYNWVLPNPEPL